MRDPDAAFEILFHEVLLEQLLHHPLPWHLEDDWTHEVVAADGTTIARCASLVTARAILAEATDLDARIRGLGDIVLPLPGTPEPS